jgi:hypothetical protein
MSETRQLLVLTYVMATIMVLQFLGDPVAALRGLACAVPLAVVGLLLLRIRARRTPRR